MMYDYHIFIFENIRRQYNMYREYINHIVNDESPFNVCGSFWTSHCGLGMFGDADQFKLCMGWASYSKQTGPASLGMGVLYPKQCNWRLCYKLKPWRFVKGVKLLYKPWETEIPHTLWVFIILLVTSCHMTMPAGFLLHHHFQFLMMSGEGSLISASTGRIICHLTNAQSSDNSTACLHLYCAAAVDISHPNTSPHPSITMHFVQPKFGVSVCDIKECG